MTELIATVEDAAQWAGRDSAPGAQWNPVYRALLDGSEAVGTTPEGVASARPGGTASTGPEPWGPGDAGPEILLSQLTAPALLVVAVTDGARTRRLRIGLDPAATTLERSDGDRASRWSRIEVQDVPGEVAALLEETGIGADAARLEVRRREDALRLSPGQNRIARRALHSGRSPEEAFASLPDLDGSLRDALTATGPRLSLSLTLHDPLRRATQEPVTWSRLWTRGRRGLYRVDQPADRGLAVHLVGGGDVLGSLLPVLEQGLRFAAACAAEGDAR